ncbi:hypothetical protein CY34DRAFT_804447 [Suillus luteus UH-Slu-Lm8-n1]|uniref:Uncharacterized protein n=1 Tax=Suillus luteus UH-Slu-Lm8-n1 TaxID=930992 RepID=A0A0D0BI85_9AGAM|nr:hypothetical protein CY34DRAFT_804447 [Suillus luteus UH-Slu-Lm8-n1]
MLIGNHAYLQTTEQVAKARQEIMIACIATGWDLPVNQGVNSGRLDSFHVQIRLPRMESNPSN